MSVSRRAFIRQTGVALAASHLAPSFLMKAQAQFSGKRLIVIQLSGGNDGLNTIVPFRNDIYYKMRPTISVEKSSVLRVHDELGLHPALKPLEQLFNTGDMMVLNAVGYPNPDRSHFRSMDIWHSGVAKTESDTGWIGRYLDNECGGAPLHWAVEIDESLSLAMKGTQKFGMATRDIKQLSKIADTSLAGLARQPVDSNNEALSYMYKTASETRTSTEYLHNLGGFSMGGIHQYPQTEFGRNLKLISHLISAGSETQVYYTSLDGFDTHAQQQGRHARLLENYAKGVAALAADLRKSNEWKNTVILTFSEFGRRIQENGSRGTDHGTANNVFLFGGGIRGGMYNESADLSEREGADLAHKVDFRSIYATILSDWFRADPRQVLSGEYPALELFHP